MVINILPDIFGVTEISVYHKIKHKLFSKEIKKQCFTLCITRYEDKAPYEELALYDYETVDIAEVKSIFYELINNHTLPKLNNWKRIL